MAFITDWNDAFEALPTDEDYGYTIDNFFRELKIAIRERLEREHICKVGATDGLHMPGKCSVLYYGTTAEIDALTGMTDGAIAFDTTLGVIKCYTSSAWTILPFDWDAFWGAGDPVHDHSVDAEGGIISSSLKFMGTTVNLIDWVAATDWTDVDISGNVGTDTPKSALVTIVSTGLGGAGGLRSQQMTGMVRKNGSSETAILPRVVLRSRRQTYSGCSASCSLMAITEVDTDGIFEAIFQDDENGTDYDQELTFKIDLIGYFI